MTAHRVIRQLTLNPRWRLAQHVEYLRDNVTFRNSVDKKNFDHVFAAFEESANKMGYYQNLRIIVFVLLYISVFYSALGAAFSTFESFIRPLMMVFSFFGATVLSVILLILNRIINALYTDLMIEHAHLVSLAVKNNKEFVERPEYTFFLFKDYK